VIIAGGGVRRQNAREVIESTGVREMHLGPRKSRPGAMRFEAPAPRISRSGPIDEHGYSELDIEEVSAVVGLTA
jgi:copper homeostasis protein CutC